jgi:hypothetical protein
MDRIYAEFDAESQGRLLQELHEKIVDGVRRHADTQHPAW